MCVKRTAKDDDQDIVCPKCGTYLGPKQPLPHTLTLCKACHLWVNNEGKEQGHRGGFTGPSRDKKPCEAGEPRFLHRYERKNLQFQVSHGEG